MFVRVSLHRDFARIPPVLLFTRIPPGLDVGPSVSFSTHWEKRQKVAVSGISWRLGREGTVGSLSRRSGVLHVSRQVKDSLLSLFSMTCVS